MIQIQMINIRNDREKSANSPKYNSKRTQAPLSLGKLNLPWSEEIDYKSKELTNVYWKCYTESTLSTHTYN